MTPVQFLWVLIPAVSCILYVTLFILRRQDVGDMARWFQVLLFAAAWWSLGSMLLHLDLGPAPAVWIQRVTLVGSLAIPLIFFGFVIHFLSRRNLLPWASWGVLFYLGVQIVNLNGYVVSDVQVVRGEVFQDLEWGVMVASIYWSFYIYFAAFLLIREMTLTEDAAFRSRVKYNLVVLALLWAGNTANATALQAYPVDLLLAAVAALLIFVSSSRYQFLEVERSFRRLLLLLVVGVTYVVFASLSLNILGHIDPRYLATVSVVVGVLTALLLYSYPPLRQGLLGFIDRVFLPQQYDSAELIYAISRRTNHLLLPAALGAQVLAEIGRAFELSAAAMFVRSSAQDEYELVAAYNLEGEIGAAHLRADSPLIRELSAAPQAMHVDRLRELPRLRALWISEWQLLEALRAQALAPILSENRLEGFFTLGPKLGGEPYTRQELRVTLPTLANQVSIALANSRSYAEAQARADALAQMNEELRRLDRMKDELLQNLSHELRTPLAVLHGYAELLQDGMYEKVGISADELSATIMRQSARLGLLVNDIVYLTQIEHDTRPFEPVDLVELLEACVRDLDLSLKPGVEVVIRKPEAPLPAVWGLAHRLYQLVNNLLDNAIKYSPAGSRVQVSLAQQGEEVVMAVSDQGPGIDAAQQAQIWDRFYRGDASLTSDKRGLGLGLAIVKKVIDLHKGWIVLESQPGQGSTFRFGLRAATIDLSPPLLEEQLLA